MFAGSLMYTKLHQNRYWRVFIEMWVILHGGIVASQTGGPEMDGTLLWPMFGFGFAFVFVVTQVRMQNKDDISNVLQSNPTVKLSL